MDVENEIVVSENLTNTTYSYSEKHPAFIIKPKHGMCNMFYRKLELARESKFATTKTSIDECDSLKLTALFSM